MTAAIHIEMLNFIGAKTFLDVLQRGQSAFLPATQEILGLAFTMLRKDPPKTGQDSLLRAVMGVEPTLEKKGLTLFTKGLSANGEAGVKEAARLVYESVFVAAGLPITNLFKTVSYVSPVVSPVPSPVPANESPDFVAHVTKEVFKCIADQLGVQLQDVTPDKRLVLHLGADSLDLIELTMCIEDELGIEIPDEVAERVVTVKDAVDMAVRLRREQNPF